LTEWHVITGEYPPQRGGVSDYTRLVALGLAATGDIVHVWCPHLDAPRPDDSGVIVHSDLGAMTPLDLLRAGRMLDEFRKPRRILLQWVPHAFGLRSANLPLSFWIWNRAFAHKDDIELMIHEPYLPMGQEHLRHSALAVAHRIMLVALLASANRVWTAIPRWEEFCRPYTLGRPVQFNWLPVFSNIPVHEKSIGSRAVRARYLPSGGFLIGHFGTCSGAIGATLRAVIPELLNHHRERAVLLIGRGSQELCDQLRQAYLPLRGRIHSTDSLSGADVSSHVSACDVMLQPYPDGASSRRGGLMAALSHGKPIVTTSGDLTEPLWHESGSVALAPAGNHPQIVISVEKLLADECERERLSGSARSTYARRFALANTIRMLRNEAALPL
jgi:hypothetical protein